VIETIAEGADTPAAPVNLAVNAQTPEAIGVTSVGLAATAPIAAAETKTLRFPASRTLGRLLVQTRVKPRRYRLGPDYDALSGWEFLAEAQGEVRVPVGRRLKLDVAQSALGDLSALANLGPTDLYALSIAQHPEVVGNADTRVMPHIAGLTGLKELYLMIGHTDKGLKHLRSLTELEELRLCSTSYGDAGLRHIEGLRSLKALQVSGQVTDAGLARLAQLPLLRELQVDARGIRGSGFSHLAESPSLEFLCLSGKVTSGNTTLHNIGKMTSLKSLTLFGEGLHITDAGLPALANLTDLEELRFVWISTITDAGIAKLKPLRSLKLLDLHVTRVTDKGLADVASLYTLEDLTLPQTGITDKGLAHVSRLKRLKRLNARGMTPLLPTESGPFTDKGLRDLSRLPNLEELSIVSGVGITDAGVAHIARLRNLENLSLMCDGITDDAMATLSTIGTLKRLTFSCPNLRAITISGTNHLGSLTNLEFLDMKHIVQDGSTLDLSGLTNLESLMTYVVEDGVRSPKCALRDEDLAWLSGHPRIKWVQVGLGVDFSDVGMAHLAGLTQLERLSVGGDRVTDAGLTYLEGMNSLTLLSLEGNITDEGLRQVGKLGSMSHLYLKTPNECSPAALDRLWEALPQLCDLRLNGKTRPMMGAATMR